MDRISRLAYGVLVAFLVLIPVSAMALAPPVTPIGLRNIVKSGSVLDGKVSYQIGLGSAATYVERGVTFGGLTMGKLALGFLRGGIYNALFTAILSESAYLFDQASGEVKTTGDPGGYSCDGYYEDGFLSVKACSYLDWHALFEPAVESWGLNSVGCQVVNFAWISEQIVVGGESQVKFDYQFKCGSSTGSVQHDQTIVKYTAGTITQPPIPGSPVTEEQLGQQVINRGSPALWEQMLTDPATGQPVTTPEIQQQRWDIQKEQAEKAGDDPTTVPAPVQTGGIDEGTGNSASEPEPETDIPPFCTWAKAACDFYTWVMGDPVEPEKVPLPLVDVPQPSSWDSGLSSAGTCPPDSTIPIWGDTTIRIPWQPACDGADLLRPVLYAMAYFIAAGILIGRRGGAS